MFPEDIEFLFEQVGVDTEVRIINEPVKMGWDGERLHLEAHRVLDETPAAVEDMDGVVIVEPGAEPEGADMIVEAPVRGKLTTLTVQFVAATNAKPGELDWDQAERLLERADGIPAPVGRSIKNAATSAASE
jgi:L,D-transpeptidase ErfK/SrfK